MSHSCTSASSSRIHPSMMLGLLISCLLVSITAAASPIVAARNNDGLEWFSNDPSLPKIIIYDAGGTIRSASAYSRLDNVNYGAPGPTAAELIGNNSEVLSVAQLAIVSYPTAGGSSDLNSTLFFNISRDANQQLCHGDAVGAIMLHGTNTEEDTIFGIDLTVNCSKPIVATGAMRPDSYISSDGRSNFYQATAVAAHSESRDRGALVVFNDRITSAFYTVKLNGNTPDTFKSLEQGTVGACLGGQPYYYFRPSYPVGRYYYDLATFSSGADLPAVVVLFGHQGFDASLMYAAVANGAKGIVIQGAGAGQISRSARAAAAELKEQGIPVVASLRPVTGASVPAPNPGDYIASGYMQAGLGWEGCRQMFEQDIRTAVYNDATSYYYE